ncbi:MAG: ABC transporter permease [Actinomycetota bacterium]|nr:ABC transporter permease [Actinomycetota bacterium]MDA3028159.1 ABC transporter permease [Actinomycetota bacterium]
MFAYVLRRVLATIPLLIVTLYLVHVGVSATTNPLADFYLCLPRCQQGFDRIVEVYNLDVSIWVRPFYWFQDAARGDLGFSSAIGIPVTEVLTTRGWNTAMIAIPAFIGGSVIALLLSVYSARRPYSKGDYFFTALSFIGFAFPSFVMALLLQNIFGVQFENWFGVKPFNTGRKTGDSFLTLLRDITLPATSLAILGIAADSRFGRAAMLETLNQDYIRTARAKGLDERRVVWKHAMRNALIPIVTLWALNFSALLGGAVVTESIFSWPGLGPAFLKALGEPDLALVLGFVIFTGVVTVLFNLIADLLYGVLDPRVRFD